MPADNPAFTHELSDSATKPSAPDHKPCASVTLMSYNSVPAPLPPVSLPPHSTAKPRGRVSPLTYIRSSLVILALSIHSLFEGMAIGSQFTLCYLRYLSVVPLASPNQGLRNLTLVSGSSSWPCPSMPSPSPSVSAQRCPPPGSGSAASSSTSRY